MNGEQKGYRCPWFINSSLEFRLRFHVKLIFSMWRNTIFAINFLPLYLSAAIYLSIVPCHFGNASASARVSSPVKAWNENKKNWDFQICDSLHWRCCLSCSHSLNSASDVEQACEQWRCCWIMFRALCFLSGNLRQLQIESSLSCNLNGLKRKLFLRSFFVD